MFFLFFSFLVSSEPQKITFTADWSDTTPLEEAFEYIDGEIPDFSKKYANEFKGDATAETILSDASQFMMSIQKESLDLALRTRLMNPKASLSSKTQRKPAPVHGWYAMCHEKKPVYDPLNFQFHVLSAFNTFNDHYERLGFLREMVTNIPNYVEAISKVPIDESIKNDYIYNKPGDGSFLLVNGRHVSPNVYSITQALIEERRNYEILVERFRTTPHIFERFSRENVDLEVFHYTEQLDSDNGCEIFTPASKYYEKPVAKSFNKENEDSFMKTPINKFKVNIYFALNSSEALPLMRYAFDIEKREYPIDITVFPIPERGNETEETICVAFYRILKYFSLRGALLFLYTGMQTGDYERAYNDARPDVKWSELSKNETRDFSIPFIRNVQRYAERKGLTGAEVSVNGHFIKGSPKFMKINGDVHQQISKLYREAVYNGLSIDNNWTEYYKNNSIVIDKARPPIEISDRDVFDISSLGVDAICSASIEMKKYIVQNGSPNSPIVCTFGYKIKVPDYATLCVVDKENELLSKFFDKKTKEMTLVGPYKFNRKLTRKEISYVARYVSLSIMKKLQLYEFEQRFAGTLIKGQDVIKKLKRYDSPNTYTLIRYDEKNPIQIYLNYDIFTKEFPLVINALMEVADSHTAGISLHPIFPNENVHCVPPPFSAMFPDETGTATCDGEFQGIVYPNNFWGVEQTSNTSYRLKTVVVDGYTDKGRVVNIDREIMPMEHNGYFITAAPIGKYESLNVDSFVPLHKRVNGIKVNNNKEDDGSLHIVVNHLSNTRDVFDRVILSMATQNSSNVKYHIVSTIPVTLPDAIDAEIIPLFAQLDLNNGLTTSNIWGIDKFILAANVAPNSHRVIVTDGNVEWYRDPSILMNLDMNGCALGASVFTNNRRVIKNKPWMEPRKVSERFKRPYLNSAVIIFDTKKWRESNGQGLALQKQINMEFERSITVEDSGDLLLNYIQLIIQTMTLDPQLGVIRASSTKAEYNDAISKVIADYDGDNIFIEL